MLSAVLSYDANKRKRHRRARLLLGNVCGAEMPKQRPEKRPLRWQWRLPIRQLLLR